MHICTCKGVYGSINTLQKWTTANQSVRAGLQPPLSSRLQAQFRLMQFPGGTFSRHSHPYGIIYPPDCSLS